jgi:hypothetical protein
MTSMSRYPGKCFELPVWVKKNDNLYEAKIAGYKLFAVRDHVNAKWGWAIEPIDDIGTPDGNIPDEGTLATAQAGAVEAVQARIIDPHHKQGGKAVDHQNAQD